MSRSKEAKTANEDTDLISWYGTESNLKEKNCWLLMGSN